MLRPQLDICWWAIALLQRIFDRTTEIRSPWHSPSEGGTRVFPVPPFLRGARGDLGLITYPRAIAQLIEMGYAPTLQYQWNPKRNEFDLFAVIHDRPLAKPSKRIADSLMDKQACDALWAAFNQSSLYVIGCEAAQNPNWLAAGSFKDARRHAAPEEIEPLQANAAAAA